MGCWKTISLASWGRALDIGDLLDEAIPPTNSDLVENGHDGQSGLAIIRPSTVPVVAATLSMTSLSRSPAAATKETGAVVNSVGVTPAVPPPCTGERS